MCFRVGGIDQLKVLLKEGSRGKVFQRGPGTEPGKARVRRGGLLGGGIQRWVYWLLFHTIWLTY